jgi:nucleotide-binding universal stress UspA family protein
MITIKNILVATDFGAPSEAALEYGRQIARLSGATLHVLHVVPDAASQVLTPVGMVPDLGGLQMDLEDDARHRLEQAINENDRDLKSVIAVISSTAPARAILAYAESKQIDLIVLGTHGRSGLAHLLMGSVAEHVVRSAPCSVLTVREKQRQFVRPDALELTGAMSS